METTNRDRSWLQRFAEWLRKAFTLGEDYEAFAGWDDECWNAWDDLEAEFELYTWEQGWSNIGKK